MLGMSDLNILVKKAFDRGFIDSHVLGSSISRRSQTGDRASLANHGRPDDHDDTLFG